MDAKTDKVTWALSKALEGLAARQAAIASNIANIDTPGYRAVSVTFEQQLQRAVRSMEGAAPAGADERHFPLGGDAVSDFAPSVQRISARSRNDRNGVDIDQQMVQLAETTAQYESITRLLSYRISMLRTVISDGRR